MLGKNKIPAVNHLTTGICYMLFYIFSSHFKRRLIRYYDLPSIHCNFLLFVHNFYKMDQLKHILRFDPTFCTQQSSQLLLFSRMNFRYVLFIRTCYICIEYVSSCDQFFCTIIFSQGLYSRCNLFKCSIYIFSFKFYDMSIPAVKSP